MQENKRKKYVRDAGDYKNNEVFKWQSNNQEEIHFRATTSSNGEDEFFRVNRDQVQTPKENRSWVRGQVQTLREEYIRPGMREERDFPNDSRFPPRNDFKRNFRGNFKKVIMILDVRSTSFGAQVWP